MRQSSAETGEKRGIEGEINSVIAQGLNGENTQEDRDRFGQRQGMAETEYKRDSLKQSFSGQRQMRLETE